MLRISGGLYKNRLVPTVKGAKYRPVTSKFREALFSVISSGSFIGKNIIENARFLDLYSGSGIMGFEFLSRGVSFVTFVELDPGYLGLARKFALESGLGENTEFLNLNVLRLSKAKIPYDIIFMDPPYGFDLIQKTLEILVKGFWLKAGGIIIVESAKNEEILPAGRFGEKLFISSERLYGSTKMTILSSVGIDLL